MDFYNILEGPSNGLEMLNFFDEVLQEQRADGSAVLERGDCVIMDNIEITSWKARAYGIFTLVGFVSEISLIRCAHLFDFRYFTNSCENPVQSAFHAVICLFYTY